MLSLWRLAVSSAVALILSSCLQATVPAGTNPTVNYCDQLSPPFNGEMSGRSLSINSQTTFSCNPGYTMFGSARRTCLANTKAKGKWSGQPTFCAATWDYCDHLRAPANGEMSGRGLSINTQRTFSCNPGYTIVGSARRICQANNEARINWSGQPTFCPTTRDYCDRLRAPANGEMSGRGLSINSQRTFSCNPGYTIVGSARRTCQANTKARGKWSGQPTFCTTVICKPKIHNGAFPNTTEAFFNDVITYTCPEGLSFNPMDHKSNTITAKCLYDNTVSTFPGMCQEIDECVNSPCDQNAVCRNSLGSFSCVCDDGFLGDGFTCTEKSCSSAGLAVGCTIGGVAIGLAIGWGMHKRWAKTKKNKEFPQEKAARRHRQPSLNEAAQIEITDEAIYEVPPEQQPTNASIEMTENVAYSGISV